MIHLAGDDDPEAHVSRDFLRIQVGRGHENVDGADRPFVVDEGGEVEVASVDALRHFGAHRRQRRPHILGRYTAGIAARHLHVAVPEDVLGDGRDLQRGAIGITPKLPLVGTDIIVVEIHLRPLNIHVLGATCKQKSCRKQEKEGFDCFHGVLFLGLIPLLTKSRPTPARALIVSQFEMI